LNNKTVMLALSGGVDSSVCAELLKRDGYSVKAVVMKMSPAHDDTVKSAKQAADALSIPLTVLDLTEVFEKKVIEPFINDYRCAKTPNPCVICNPYVKFHYLSECAKNEGCTFIATGHYCSIDKQNGRFFVKKSDCVERDQSYMLYRLPQEVLKRLIFPLSSYSKTEVRQIARDLGLFCAEAPDSQENCFIPSNDYAAYIEERCGKMPQGDFISPEGKICGKHKGIIHYTIGQRKGLGIALGKPTFIREIDADTNNIYLAYEGGQNKDEILVGDCTFMLLEGLTEPTVADVKIRSAAKCEKAILTPLENGIVKVNFEKSVRAPAKGQSAVFYIGDAVLGGGFIL